MLPTLLYQQRSNSNNIKFADWIFISFWIVQFGHQMADTFNIKECDSPLGMESGGIADSAISASSSYVPNVGPQNGRLRMEKLGGAWCPKQQIEHNVREYLQVDLENVYVITGIQTQGRFDRGRGQEYTEEYTIEYWRPKLNSWKKYKRWDGKEIMTGNSDTFTIVTLILRPPVFASKIRILPYSIHPRTVCLRLELKGCLLQSGIASYQIPEDSSWNDAEYLNDVSYDGNKTDGFLMNGLGRLVDGILGGDNFKIDVGYGKGSGWVGWQNDSFPSSFIELIFEFDQIRNFSSVHFFTNNAFKNAVQVFSKARIIFSVGGNYYNSHAIIYTYMPDTILENARNVTIHLNHNIAKFVKIQLYFANKWIMLSEVIFESEVVAGNYTEELKPQPNNDIIYDGTNDPPWESPQTISAQKKKASGDYVDVMIGLLTTLILLLLGIFLIVVIVNHRQKLENSPTAILKNPFGVGSMKTKDVLVNISPATSNIIVNPTHIYEERHKNEFETMARLVTTDEKSISDSYTNNAYYKLPSTPKKPDLVQSDKQQNYESKYLKRENSDCDIQEKLTSIETNNNNECVDYDNQQKNNNYENVRAKKDSYTNPAMIYRSLRKLVHEPDSSSPPSPVPETPDELMLQRDQQVIYDTISKKRYHTSPHDRHKQAPAPTVSWNIAPATAMPYKCREGDIVPFPRYFFKVCSKLGSCHLGEIILCETNSVDFCGCGRIAAKTCKGDMMREIRLLTALQDQNLVRVFGVCTAEQPPWLIMEYPAEYGDILFLLQNRNNIKYSTLMYMNIQIASAMKYLEAKNLVHKDLAARNCLVSRGFVVKIADIAICNNAYRKHYADLENRPAVPVRWLPWESILLEKYLCSSSVWSFGVTLWEILNLARDVPFPHLTDEQVVQNAENLYYGDQLKVAYLPKPAICSAEIYELMCECWERDYNRRPTFKKIYSFLKRNNVAYTADLDRQTCSQYTSDVN